MTATRFGAAVVAVAALLAGCGSDDARTPIEGPTAPTAAPRPTTSFAPPSSMVNRAGDPATVGVSLREVATLDSPTALVARSGGDDLYAAERDGVVRRLVRSGDAFDVDDTPTLDITTEVGNTGGERGLLGLAFAPDGDVLYVSYTDGDDDGASVLARYSMSGTTADPGSRIEVLRIAQPYPNHNGGNIVFGPDGYLYAGFGDGGSQGDPEDNGQDLGTLLGKMLRIDVSQSSADTPYLVPADNPFVDDAAARREIWALGLRNPWRFSFDRLNGDLWIGDVGGAEWEEVDHLPATANVNAGRGSNLGWSLREGAHDTDKPGTRPSDLVEPIFEYDHDEGSSITGGLVYRGSAVPDLTGVYLYSDYSSARLWGLTVTNGQLDRTGEISTTGHELSQVVSFAEDLDREVYVVELGGAVVRIEPA